MAIFENILQDLRYGIRALGKNPGVTSIAILSLALGIGANTAIFSLMDTLLVKMLPVQDPAALVLLTDPGASGVSHGTQDGVRTLLSFGEYSHIREKQQVFSGIYAAESNSQRVSATIDAAEPEEVRMRLVTGSYFDTLGVRAARGRTFTLADDVTPSNAPYLVISHAFWVKRFGQRDDVIGKVVKLRYATLTIIGVASADFFGETVGDAPDAWVPMMMQPSLRTGTNWLKDDESKVDRVMWLQVMGRMKTGVTLQQVQANMDVAFAQMLNSYHVPGLNAAQRKNQLDQKIKISEGGRGASSLRNDFATPLAVLMGVVGLVLLIACANIANLLLARAAARQKEIAIRLAMGASRMRIGAQLVTESVLLSTIGGALGLLVAWWGTGLLLRVVSTGRQAIPLAVELDLRVLGFTALLSILTGLLFGLAPAFRGTKVDVAPTLKDNSRGVSGGARQISLGKILVVSQIAISLLLLIGSGLFLRTLINLKNIQLGYSRENLVLFYIDALSAGYKEQAAADVFIRLQNEFKAIPGVKSATFSHNGLFSGGESGTGLDVEGYTPANPRDGGARFDQIGPNYFSSLGIEILKGREIGPQDTAAATPVCVINETMAKDFFAGRDPIGKQIRDTYPGSKSHFEIVGVVRNARDHNLRGEVRRRFYVPVTHAVGGMPSGMNFEVRTFNGGGGLNAALRQKIANVDKSLRLVEVRTMDEMVDGRIVQERIIAQLSTFFGGLALLLASIGLYGVLSYSVARRTSEIGIRMALGAARGTVLWMILQETLVLIAVGSVIGIGAALWAGKLVASQVFEVSTADPVTIAISAATIFVVSMMAAYIPALRVARVDPMIALRVE